MNNEAFEIAGASLSEIIWAFVAFICFLLFVPIMMKVFMEGVENRCVPLSETYRLFISAILMKDVPKEKRD